MNLIGLLIAAFAVYCYLAVALPAKGRIARGGLVGIRTPATKRTDAAWLAGHRAALPSMTGTVAVAVIFSLLVTFGAFPFDLSPQTALLIGLGICIGGLVASAPVAVRAARATTPTVALRPGAPESDVDRSEGV